MYDKYSYGRPCSPSNHMLSRSFVSICARVCVPLAKGCFLFGALKGTFLRARLFRLKKRYSRNPDYVLLYKLT